MAESNIKTEEVTKKEETKVSLKEVSPKTFAFFSEFWSFMTKYWNVPHSDGYSVAVDEWWGCFENDIKALLKRYDDSSFYNDIIVAFYNRCLQCNSVQDGVEYVD